MIKAGALAKGMAILLKNEPHSVVEREFYNPGKGSAVVRLRLKNLKTGLTVAQTIKTQDSVDEIDVEERNCQYLFSDADSYHFMDNMNYEQYAVGREGYEDVGNFLKEGEAYKIIIYEGRPIDVILPLKITLKVTEANEGLRGDTVTGATKPVKLETGVIVRVPLFIKEGEKVVINTETKEYVERTK